MKFSEKAEQGVSLPDMEANMKKTDDRGEETVRDWMVSTDDVREDSISTESSSLLEDSTNSASSFSSSDLVEDASSSLASPLSSSSTSLSHGPLYELSELMATLPMKRGLSKFYQGKAQSFTSLASVGSLEDLPKKITPYRRKVKSCKSYGGGLDGHHSNRSYQPKATISKPKTSRLGSFLSMIATSNRGRDW